MKKNLKKVISAVLALALSISSFAAVSFAAEEEIAPISFTDVPSTASYAEGVSVLSALGIVAGKGEGKFDPEGLVKRSEAAKMVVGMVNAIAAAEKKAGRTSFNDVAADHWASGYIQQGVDMGWLSGKGAGRFDPDGNVKVEELIKMVVVNMGWAEDYLLSFGTYPLVFTNKAEEYEVVAAGQYDYKAAATRAEVAEIIYEAMKAPIAKDGKNSEWSDNKNGWVTKPEAQDGTNGTYYRSLLSEKFNAYAMEGIVTDTARNNPTWDAEEVTFDIVKSELYAEDKAVASYTTNATTGVTTAVANELARIDAGATAAADYINTYSNAVIAIDKYTKDATILAIVPSGRNTTYEVEADLLKEGTTGATIEAAIAAAATATPVIEYYPTANSSRAEKYELNTNVALYVNGVKVTRNATNLDAYLVNNTIGTVKLVDVYGVGAVKGAIDCIYVDFYATAEVTGISGDIISLKNFFPRTLVPGVIDLDTEDKEELVYTITVDGAEGTISDVKKGDVISVAWNVNESDIADSLFYDIYVARDVVTGKVTGKDNTLGDENITVGGEKYVAIDWTNICAGNKVTAGNEYDIKLDAFGRIYSVEEVASNEKYAMVIDAGVSNFKNQVRFLLADGTKATYPLKDSATFAGGVTSFATLQTYVNTQKTAKDYENLIAKYTMRNSEITGIEILAAANTPAMTEYNERTGSVSNMYVTASTIIFDATAAKDTTGTIDDLKIADIDTFVDDQEYTVSGFGKEGTKYKVAVITAGESSYNKNTMFAVVSKAAVYSIEEEDEDKTGYTVEVVENGAVKKLFIEDGVLVDGVAITDAALAIGDVIVYKADTNGEAKEVTTLFAVEAKAAGYQDAIFADLATTTIDGNGVITLPVVGGDWTKSWNSADKDDIALVYAPIIEVENDVMYLAQVDAAKTTNMETEVAKDATTNTGAIYAVSFDEDTRVAIYDYSKANAKDRVSAGDYGRIFGSVIVTDRTATTPETIHWDDATQDGIANAKAAKNLAFAKIVDGVATDVYVIMVEGK